MTFHGRDAGATGSPSTQAGGSFAALASLLWSERELLRRLEFNLAMIALIVRSGEWDWLSFADDEVRATSEQLQASELMRAAESELLARQSGLAGDATLGELAARAPEPWQCILRDHHQALRALTAAVDAGALATDRLLREAEAAEWSASVVRNIASAVRPARTDEERPDGAAGR
ncbi:MAG TPA: hypothetical protein VFH38_12470 [Jatrophihabitans sp.]|nr:hypothetical protein [Jatrophihabitans sp.]